MLDDPLSDWCPCPQCRIARSRGLMKYGRHKYDDIHAEDVSWSFKVFCRCRRCTAERKQLARRVIRPDE